MFHLKNVKRVRLVSCLILSIMLIAACGSSEPDEVFEGTYDSESNGASFGGYEMVYKYGGNQDQVGDGCIGYEFGTELDDAARKRVADLENNRNCKILYQTDINAYSNFIAATTSGVYYCDAVWEHSGAITDMAKIGGVQGITPIGTIDYTDFDKWGTTRVLESLYYKDDLYGVLPSLWPEKADNFMNCVLVVNEDLIARLGVEDPREYIDTGEWNWKKFESVLPVYYNEEGGEVKHYAMDGAGGYFSQMMVLSDGGKLAYRNSAGEYEPSCFTDTYLMAMTEAVRIYKGEYAYTIREVDPNIFIMDYCNGDAVLATMSSRYIIGSNGTVCKNMDNFGILSFPLGPNAPEGYKFSTNLQLEGSLGISTFAKDIDTTAAILDALYAPINGIDSPEKVIQYLKRNYFFDDRDAENYFAMVVNSQFMYFASTLYNTSLAGYINTTMTMTQYLESNKNGIMKDFEDLIKPAILGTNAVWGEGTY